MEENKQAENKNNESQNGGQKPLRDDKGHFVSNPNASQQGGKRIRKTKKQREEEAERKEDENTVKIRIIKDEKPLPKKDFEGRLEDMKERTASNFIKSVAIRKPRRISIDGTYYYSKDVLDNITKKYIQSKGNEDLCLEALKKSIDTMIATDEAMDNYASMVKGLKKSRSIWRSISIGLFVALVSFCITLAIGKNNTGKTTEKAPIIQVQGGSQQTIK